MSDFLKRFFSVTSISIFIGLLGILLAVYFYYKSIHKELVISIDNQIGLINTSKPLKNLDIEYKNKNILDSNKTLELYTLKFENIGNDIRENDFSSKAKFGIRTENAEVIEIRALRTENNYVKKNLSPSIENKNFINLEKIMLDNSMIVYIDFVILRDTKTKTKIKIEGKISGVEKLIITESSNGSISIFNFDFSQYNWLDYILLLFIILVLGTIELVIILFTIFRIGDFFDNRSDRKLKTYFGSNEDVDFRIYGSANLRDLVLMLKKDKYDKSEIINHFLYYVTKNKSLLNIKKGYEKNIDSFIEKANKIYKLETGIKSISSEIEREEKKIMIDKKVSYFDIKDTSKESTFSHLIPEVLTQLYSKLNTEKIKLFKVEKVDEDTIFNIYYKDILVLLKHNLIIEIDKNKEIKENKLFIQRVNKTIKYFKLETTKKIGKKIYE